MMREHLRSRSKPLEALERHFRSMVELFIVKIQNQKYWSCLHIDHRLHHKCLDVLQQAVKQKVSRDN